MWNNDCDILRWFLLLVASTDLEMTRVCTVVWCEVSRSCCAAFHRFDGASLPPEKHHEGAVYVARRSLQTECAVSQTHTVSLFHLMFCQKVFTASSQHIWHIWRVSELFRLVSCPSLFVAVKSPAFPHCLPWPNCPRLQGHLPAATPMNSPSQQPQRTWLDDGSYLKMPAVRWWSNYGLIAIFSYCYYSILLKLLYNLLFFDNYFGLSCRCHLTTGDTKIKTTAYSRLHVLRNHLVPHQSAKAT